MEYVAVAVPKEKARDAEELIKKAVESVMKIPELGVPDPRQVIAEFERLARKEGKKEIKYVVVREHDIPITGNFDPEKVKEAVRKVADEYIRSTLGPDYEIVYEKLVPTWIYDPAPLQSPLTALRSLLKNETFKITLIPLGVAGGVVALHVLARIAKKLSGR